MQRTQETTPNQGRNDQGSYSEEENDDPNTWPDANIRRVRNVITIPGTNDIWVYVVFANGLSRGTLYAYEEAKRVFTDELAIYLCNSERRNDFPRQNDKFTWAYDHFEDRAELPRGFLNNWGSDNEEYLRAWFYSAESPSLVEEFWLWEEIENRLLNFAKRHVDYLKYFNKRTREPGLEADYAIIDSGCDTCGLGGSSWVIDTMTDRKVQISGYDVSLSMKEVKIGSGITAVDVPSGETYLLRIHEATILGDECHSLLSVTQLRESGTEVDEKSRRHGGGGFLSVDGIILPLVMKEGMMTLRIRKPTEDELSICEMIDATMDTPW